MASINLDPQSSGSNQDSEERNQVVLAGQGPQRVSIARVRSQKSTQGKYSKFSDPLHLEQKAKSGDLKNI
ncbi:hypothetical protein P5673_017168 [Acropora cervicornis]|uniref:Uncharacterized protein n=1 Tax=Acropora cervicornis TaxID=6130 RepID=A0AAD9QF76_ACRCE|nr:hypothetical protein P5673_017168 [Acropora cervicornis]